MPEWPEAPAIQLSQLAPFADLDPAVIGALEAASTIVELEPGEVLFRQGDPGDALYVIVTGRAQVLIEQANGPAHVLAEVQPGECLGEMALLSRQPRAATAVAVDSASLVKMPMDACEHLMEAATEMKDRLVGVALRRLPSLYLASMLLGGATSGALVELDRSATWVRLAAGQTLFRRGDPSDALYVVTHGSLDVLVDEPGVRRVAAVLGRGAFLGEMGVLLGEPRSATVRARHDAELIRIRTMRSSARSASNRKWRWSWLVSWRDEWSTPAIKRHRCAPSAQWQSCRWTVRPRLPSSAATLQLHWGRST